MAWNEKTFDIQGITVKFTESMSISISKFWDRLNHKPHDIYVRFQKRVAKKNNGKWIRGIKTNIFKGINNQLLIDGIRFNLE